VIILPLNLHEFAVLLELKENAVELSDEFIGSVRRREADLGDYIGYKFTTEQITKMREEFTARISAEEQKETLDKRIAECKLFLRKVTEDEAQIAWGLIVPDIAEKRAISAQIVNELRGYEGKAPKNTT
jgi:lipoate-protein ligase A